MTRDLPDAPKMPGPTAMIDALTTLAVVLDHENAALLSSDFSVSGMLAGAKRDAIAALEMIVGTGATPVAQPMLGWPANRMIALQRRLDDAIGKNRVLLQRSIDTQQRVIATVVGALDSTDGDCGYPVHQGGDAGHRSVTPVALVLRA